MNPAANDALKPPRSHPLEPVAHERAERSSPHRLKLGQGFFIGYAIWLAPCLVRLGFGTMTTYQALYSSVWIGFIYLLALSIIGLVYRAASTRGLSLKAASVFSLVAAVPAMTVAYLIDFKVVEWEPRLADSHLNEPHTVLYAMVTALGDSVAIATMLAALVFLPAFARVHEERNRELEQLARDAELLRLRAHLEPHFVLNTLNAVAGLVEEDPPQARELLAALGDLFREASAFRQVHGVRAEIEWIERYVTIHEMRYPDLLHVRWEIAEEVLELECPALILQPLVENAVKHGVLRGDGNLWIRAQSVAGQLRLEVVDDGPELGAPRHGGRGLSIIRRRLELEGLGADAFELVREGRHTVARLRLPLTQSRRAPMAGTPRGIGRVGHG